MVDEPLDEAVEPIEFIDLVELFQDFPDGTITVGLFALVLAIAGMYIFYAFAKGARSPVIVSGTFAIFGVALFVLAFYIFPEFSSASPIQVLSLMGISLIVGALALPIIVILFLQMATGYAAGRGIG